MSSPGVRAERSSEGEKEVVVVGMGTLRTRGVVNRRERRERKVVDFMFVGGG